MREVTKGTAYPPLDSMLSLAVPQSSLVPF